MHLDNMWKTMELYSFNNEVKWIGKKYSAYPLHGLCKIECVLGINYLVGNNNS